VRLIITDFSTRDASAIAEAFIPWTGAGRALLRVISKTAIAANEATTHRPSGMAICFSIDPFRKPVHRSVLVTRDKSVTTNTGQPRLIESVNLSD
jgi:hypothetical protein